MTFGYVAGRDLAGVDTAPTAATDASPGTATDSRPQVTESRA
jgi:hypothetical protein